MFSCCRQFSLFLTSSTLHTASPQCFTTAVSRLMTSLSRAQLTMTSSCLLSTDSHSSWPRFDERSYEPDSHPVHQYVGDHYKRSSSVYVWGYAEVGALGISRLVKPRDKKIRTKKLLNRPRRLPFSNLVRIRQLACGYGFSVLSDGRYVYGTGLNTDSQIGLHEARRGEGLEMIVEPVMIKLPLTKQMPGQILNVSCGRAHTIIQTTEGIFSLGNNAHGQCGRAIVKDEIFKKSPLVHKIKGLPDDVREVCCGLDHTLFLTESGQVWSCGWSADGQTGLGCYESVGVVQRVRGDIENEKIEQVASAGDCVLAVNSSGDVFGWGNSEYGQLSTALTAGDTPQVSTPAHLALPQTIGAVRQVAVGASACYVLNERGEVYVWGCGVLGLGPLTTHTHTPQLMPMPLFGKNIYSEDVTVRKIYAGVHMAAAINTQGLLYTWGQPMCGHLGLAQNSRTQFFPFKVALPSEVQHISIGFDHVAALCQSFT